MKNEELAVKILMQAVTTLSEVEEIAANGDQKWWDETTIRRADVAISMIERKLATIYRLIGDRRNTNGNHKSPNNKK